MSRMASSRPSVRTVYTPGLVASKTKVMISNIPSDVNDKDLVEIFSQFCDESNPQSKVVSCKCGGDGFGYVLFSDEESAQTLLSSNLQVGANTLKMRFAMTVAGGLGTGNASGSDVSVNTGQQATNLSKFARKESWSVKQEDESSVSEAEDIAMHSDNSNSGTDSGDSTLVGTGNGKNGNKGSGFAQFSLAPGMGSARGSMSVNIDNGDLLFGRRSTMRQKRARVRSVKQHVISRHDACNMIEDYIGPKEKYVLILGEMDFSFSWSIARSFGNGHNVISTSLHTENSARNLTSMQCKHSIHRNVHKLRSLRTNYNDAESIVLRGFDALKLRESLVKTMGNQVGSVIAFDTVLFALPLALGSNHFDIRNLVFLKRLFENINSVVNRGSDVKPQIHLLMPIFGTRSQFESYKIEEIGKYCKLKWRLKTVKIFDRQTLSCAFSGYVQRETYGRVLNKRSTYAQHNFDYTGYYIMEAM